jgi:hypothetical protein
MLLHKNNIAFNNDIEKDINAAIRKKNDPAYSGIPLAVINAPPFVDLGKHIKALAEK